MVPEIWEPNLTIIFAGPAVTEVCDRLGFPHMHQRDRFWELLEVGGITPKRIITDQERKALADGHAQGSISDPIRTIFLEKKTSQMLRLGIGLTDINRRMVVESEKDRSARPGEEDLQEFVEKVETRFPRAVALLLPPVEFTGLFRGRYPVATDIPGRQPFTIGGSEVWLLGSTTAMLRGEALRKQEDAFFALGEWLGELKRAAEGE